MEALLRLLVGSVLVGLVVVASCTDSSGPDLRLAHLVINPTFAAPPTALETGQNPARFVDNVRVLLTDPAGHVVVDTVVDWPVDQDTLRITVAVQVTGTQSFDLELQARIGTRVIFRAGPTRLNLTAGAGAPAQVTPVLEYAGPEASMTAVEIRGAPQTFVAGSEVQLTALGTLADGSQMSDPLMEWTSLDPDAASVSETGLVTVQHDAARTVTIRGRIAFTELTATVSGPIAPAALAVAAEPTILTAIGAQAALTASLVGADGGAVANSPVAWASRSPEVIGITQESASPLQAEARSIAPGSAWVVATSVHLADSLVLIVRQEVSRVEVAPDSVTLDAIDATVQVSASAFDGNEHPVADADWVWTTSDAGVATVDPDGLITAAGTGMAEVTATSGEASGALAVTVRQVVERVSVTPQSATLEAVGDTVDVTATAYDRNGHSVADASIDWASSDPAVATVDTAGLVTATGPGSSEITATSGSASATMTVAVQPVPARVALTPGTAQASALGATEQLAATAYDRNDHPVAGATFEWSTSHPGVATVDQNGLVTATGPGAAEISAAAGPAVGTMTFMVQQIIQRVVLAPVPDTLRSIGETAQLGAVAYDANDHAVADARLSWSTSDESVATVDSTGLVKAVGAGTAEVAAAAGPAADTVEVVVVLARIVTAVTIQPAQLVLGPLGSTGQFEATVLDQDGTVIEDHGVEWASADPDVVAIDAVGTVTAVGHGFGRIVAMAAAFADTATVEVQGGAVDSVVVTPALDTIPEIGATRQLSAAGYDRFGDPVAGVEFAWLSTEPSVATVTGTGLVTAVANGTAWIVAMAGDHADTATIVVLAEVERAVPVAAGSYHSCVLSRTGQAYCWGSNSQGQLGTGSGEAYSATPVPVAGGRAYTAIRAHGVSTCALDTEGQAWCWGTNHYGEIGDGTTTARPTPTAVAGGHTFVELSVGLAFACGRTDAGEVYCWGRGHYGQLGTAGLEVCAYETPCNTVPRPVDTHLRFQALDLGLIHVCALTHEGEAYCWGWNVLGALGDGTTTSRQAVEPVATDARFRAIAAGSVHTCGLLEDGTGLCWGDNWYGQAGLGSVQSALTPQPMVGGLRFSELAMSNENYIVSHSCGITLDGDSYCWGGSNGDQLGSLVGVEPCGQFYCRPTPLPVEGGPQFRALTAGWRHTCGVAESGQVYCWGGQLYGQIGDGTVGFALTPVAVTGGTGMKTIAAGGTSACMIDPGGRAWCWGENRAGQLGDGAGPYRRAANPVSVVSPDEYGFVTVATGWSHACGLAGDGTAYCWGDNIYGQLGDGSTTGRSAPVRVASEVAFQSITTGSDHTCALDLHGWAYCWGRGASGRIGDGSTGVNRLTPTAVTGEQSFAQISASRDFTCGVTDGGSVWCWGNNTDGQLGDGTQTARPYPGPLAFTGTLHRVTTGWGHACARTDSGEVYCWGRNASGQLGDGTYEDRLAPVASAAGHTFVTLEAGSFLTCGLDGVGRAFCWGSNQGLFGNGTRDGSPVPVAGATGLQLTSLAADRNVTCGVTTGGAAYCWGWRGYLGDGSTGTRPYPTPASGGIMASPPPLVIPVLDPDRPGARRPIGPRLRFPLPIRSAPVRAPVREPGETRILIEDPDPTRRPGAP